MRKSFTNFLTEANSVGSTFEQKTADMIQNWLEKNGLSKKYKASRYQTVDESDGARDEDYSDVVIEDIKSGEKFFIECKEIDRSNVINVQYDISEDGQLIPIKDKARKQLSENEMNRIKPLTTALSECDGFSKFKKFLLSDNEWLNGKKPAKYYFDNADDADKLLPGLITAYNKAVKNGEVEVDCKPFDKNKLRDSTKNMLCAALAWRLEDPDRTWDICNITAAPFFGEMLKRRYSSDKAIPARYIQFGEKLFKLDPDNDPLNLTDVPVFPSELKGNYALKFTPRFGTGSIYVTPRSEITSDFDSQYSFIDKSKWPQRKQSENNGDKTDIKCESQIVGSGRKYPKAVLTEPNESPNTFNGKKLSEIKSPSGKNIKYKFFTEKGSEYILAEDNSCQRIKCNIHGIGEAGLHNWSDFAFFTRTDDIIETEFDSAIRYAFRHRNALNKNLPTQLGYRIAGRKLYLFVFSLQDSKWHPVSSATDIFKIRNAERKNVKIPAIPRVAVLDNVSLEPKTGYTIVEFNLKNNCIVRYHPGHTVSHIEQVNRTSSSTEKSDVALNGSDRITDDKLISVYNKCKKISPVPLANTLFAIYVNGNYHSFSKQGLDTVEKVFAHLIRKHGPNYQFRECFKFSGQTAKSISGPQLKFNKTIIFDFKR